MTSRGPRTGSLLIAALLAVLIVSPSTALAAARTVPLRASSTTSGQELTDGDLTWQFAPHGIFADSRVVMAFSLLLDQSAVMSAAGLSSTPLYYADPEIRSALEGVTIDDALPLLAASGVVSPDGAPYIQQSRRCRIWTPPSGQSIADREAVVGGLTSSLVTAFAAIGVTAAPCEPAANADEADLAVSITELPNGLPDSGDTSDESFISTLPIGEVPAAAPASGSGDPQAADTGPAPAQGGNAGLAAGPRSTLDLQVVAAAVALGLLLFGGRWLSGERLDED